jgi:hypothetical protein
MSWLRIGMIIYVPCYYFDQVPDARTKSDVRRVLVDTVSYRYYKIIHVDENSFTTNDCTFVIANDAIIADDDMDKTLFVRSNDHRWILTIDCFATTYAALFVRHVILEKTIKCYLAEIGLLDLVYDYYRLWN